jgi:hypothetical protein
MNVIDSYIYALINSSNGNVDWIARIGGAGASDIGYSITTDSSGNVYVTGSYNSAPLTAFNASGTSFGTTLVNSGGTDVFIVKYDSSGTVQWVARAGGSSNDPQSHITTDSSGNVYITGSYGSSPLTAYNASGTAFGTTLPIIGGTDVFIVKYDSSGTVQWVARAGASSTTNDDGNSISTDSSGNVYITGRYLPGPLTAYNATGTAFGTTLPNSSTQYDVFIIKYNSSGTVQWVAKSGNITTADEGNSITTDSSDNVYITGYYATSLTAYNADGTAFGTTLSNSGNNDVFIIKYNSSGTVQWVARAGSTGSDIGNSITTDSSDNVYITGSYNTGVLTAYNATGTAFGTTLSSPGGNDVFIIKYNSSGTVQWVARAGSTGSDIGNSISTDSSDNVYITGSYANPLTAYNATGTAFGTTLPLTGSTDVFIIKYNSSGTVQWVSRIAGAGADIGNSITTDSSGNVYVTGSYSSNPLTVYNSSGTAFGTTLPLGTGTDVFVVKYGLA